MANRQFIVFIVNGEEFGVEITNVKEIIRVMEIFKVPNTPDYIEGLINLRGKIHTVFNLRKRFNLPAVQFDENAKIIIVNVKSLTVGFIVDEVKEIIRVEDEDIENSLHAMNELKSRYISGVVKSADRIIMLLDLESTLSVEDEKAAATV